MSLILPSGAPVRFSKLMFTRGTVIQAIEQESSVDTNRLVDAMHRLNKVVPRGGEFFVNTPTIEILRPK